MGANSFQKALLLLDRGAVDAGEQSLREAVLLAAKEGDEVTEVQACCALGELLCEQGRGGEAVPLLERVVAVRRTDDVLAYEVSRAKELLSRGAR